MKTDQILLKRFQELEAKMQEVDATRRSNHGSGVSAPPAINTEKFHEWATSVMNLLQGIFGENSTHYSNFKQSYTKFNGWDYEYTVCKGVFRSAKSDYEGGYLFNLRSLVSAEILVDEIDQANELLGAGYKDAACVITGIALETAIKQICTREGVSHSKLDKMNTDLAKKGLYNVGMQKQITAWADRRNNAAHGNWSAYTSADVDDMIRGINRFIAEYL